jgi:hypothetical protein
MTHGRTSYYRISHSERKSGPLIKRISFNDLLALPQNTPIQVIYRVKDDLHIDGRIYLHITKESPKSRYIRIPTTPEIRKEYTARSIRLYFEDYGTLEYGYSWIARYR